MIKKIVLINDCEGALKMNAASYEAKGYEVHAFSEPNPAIDYLESEQGRDTPLVIIDCMMMIRGRFYEDAGIQVAKEIRASNPRIVTFLETGFSPEEVNAFLPDTEHVSATSGNNYIDRVIPGGMSSKTRMTLAEEGLDLFEKRKVGAPAASDAPPIVVSGGSRPNYFDPKSHHNALLLLSSSPGLEHFLNTLFKGLNFSIIRVENREAAEAVMAHNNIFALIEAPPHGITGDEIAALVANKPNIPIMKIFVGTLDEDRFVTLPLSNNNVAIDLDPKRADGKWCRDMFIAPILATEGYSLAHAVQQAKRHAAYARFEQRLQEGIDKVRNAQEDPYTYAILGYAAERAVTTPRITAPRK